MSIIMPNWCRAVTVCCIASILSIDLALGAEPVATNVEVDWPQFRGPDGQGHASARELPLTWSETENVAWKVAIPGLGWSSPVIQNGQIWLTAAIDDGHSLRAIGLDQRTGEQLHDVEVFTIDMPGRVHDLNSHATPTPVIEGNRLYVHFGGNGTACLTTDGAIIWKVKLEHQTYYGPSSTPVLCDDLLIVPCQGTDTRYTAALDKQTGEIRWKQPHAGRNSESTPLVIETSAGRQLVSNLADRVVAYDPRTGSELWSVAQGDNFAQVPRPVYGCGLVFVCGGYFSPLVQAIRPDGRGDVTASHVVWSLREAVPQNPSPLIVGDELYLFSDKGIGSCLDARSGELRWRERLGKGGYASPLLADGRIHFWNDDGETSVVAVGRQFQKLSTNRLDGRTFASPAVAGRAFYVRTETHVYRIEKPA
ncbi:MAG TPA: PQQ-binding-like beta-propeller repeat protein [Pirellulales bacterium]|nr:PQQ-binding-like beta-propeller repeat protein [Pirellulales bacterium]